MLLLRRNEDGIAGGDGEIALAVIRRAQLHARTSAQDVVDLVFIMRFLLAGSARRQHIDPGAHCGYTQKLEVWPLPSAAPGLKVAKWEELLHRPAIVPSGQKTGG